MEVNQINVAANKIDYANICVYTKKIEAINLVQLYSALKSYLSFLILPEAEHYLSVYGEHLSDANSWLSKAQTFSQADAQRESAKGNAASAVSPMDQVLWDDAAKKLNYLIESWDADINTACQQIVQGISMLINEQIPLSEVQGEIIEFAAGRGVFPPVLSSEDSVTQKLDRLLRDAYVNSSTLLVKLARTITVQAELFLNRLVQTEVAFDQLDTRQSFLFETNYKLCECIEEQTQHLKSVLNYFPEKTAKKLAMRLERISLGAVLQRYEDCAEPSIAEERQDIEQEENKESDWGFDDEDVAPKLIPISEPIPTLTVSSRLQVSYEKVEDTLVASEKLLEAVIKQVALHRLQLSCSSRVKACYSKFSLFPLFRKIATQLTHYQTSLIKSLSDLTSIPGAGEISEELKQRLKTITSALENSLTRVKTYLSTLNIHHQDYSVTDDIPNWQIKLHDFILGSSEDELIMVDSRLQRIEAMDSPYLRATLIMKLDSAKMKLNDMIIANMQSWSSRLVDRETVENTLGYLGIRVHPSHLNKIAPNIRIIKKRADIKKDFYSRAADYGITAWKNVRAWLDKQVIN